MPIGPKGGSLLHTDSQSAARASSRIFVEKKGAKMRRKFTICKMIILITFCCLLIANAGEIYRWVDENGVIRFSDSPTDRNALNKNNAKSSPIIEQKTSSTGSEEPSDGASRPENTTGSNKKMTYGMIAGRPATYR